MSKLVKDDFVCVITGPDKGISGKIAKILGNKVWIKDAVNEKGNATRTSLYWKPGKTKEGKPMREQTERPIHISNIAAASPDRKKVKLRTRLSPDGKGNKVLYYTDSAGKEMTYREIVKSK